MPTNAGPFVLVGGEVPRPSQPMRPKNPTSVESFQNENRIGTGQVITVETRLFGFGLTLSCARLPKSGFSIYYSIDQHLGAYSFAPDLTITLF